MQLLEAVRGIGFDHVEDPKQQKARECARPPDRIQKERDEHAHHLVDHDLPGIGAAEMALRDVTAPRARHEDHDDGGRLHRRGRGQQPPQEQAGCRSECAGRDGRVADAEDGRHRKADQRPGVVCGLRHHECGNGNDAGLLRRRANDARAGETIVETAMIPAEEGAQESKPCGHGERDPHHRAQERPTQIERAVGVGLYDPDARHHLAKRLAPGGECDQVAAVLDQEERDQRSFRQHAEVVDREVAQLHREVDDGGIDDRENQQIDHDREEPGADPGVLRPVLVPGLDRGPVRRDGNRRRRRIRLVEQEVQARCPQRRLGAQPGDFRRAASNRQGWTRRRRLGDERLVVGNRRPEERQLFTRQRRRLGNSDARDRGFGDRLRRAEDPIQIGADVARPLSGRPVTRGVGQREIVQRLRGLGIAANREIGFGDRRGERKVVLAIAAAVDPFEAKVAALGTLHRLRRSPFSRSGASPEGIGVNSSSCRWMSARRRSASAC